MWKIGNTEERDKKKKRVPKPLLTDIPGKRGAVTSQQQQYVHETI